MICGVDEAGRGCIIGPMVFGIASLEGMDEFKLKGLGVKDSKRLSPARREELYPQIRKICETHVLCVPASELNILMNSYSLNEIEAQKVVVLLGKMKARATRVFIDSPDCPAENFTKRIKKYLKNPMGLICENKADDKYPIVGAASIMAKVTRDREIERIKEIVGEDFGSGYTSDTRTMAFLSKHVGDEKLAPYIRTKWKTLYNLGQKKLSEYSAD
ncbi:ribonuclease HII [Candidatus Micrarchaeota archaeon CG11_big_fil_rev_8_21_14_0_20_47_5]|nr:MAG: ribonuclease HII [Candidatus Micrarchaeota archaeon CG1_02_47_40]PIN82571.1 MAG: ribonuclease HII [Candidatus Micrarchaeota archaeon CG11_big_fil_rev_8_21_14_0_20_47_5]